MNWLKRVKRKLCRSRKRENANNTERFDEIEFIVQKFSDDHELKRETVALIVSGTYHRLGQLKIERGMRHVEKIISYAPDHRIAKGTWNYLDQEK